MYGQTFFAIGACTAKLRVLAMATTSICSTHLAGKLWAGDGLERSLSQERSSRDGL